MKYFLIIFLGFCLSFNSQAQSKEPIKLAVVGMSHGHIPFILKRPDKGDIQLVGFCETNPLLIEKLSKKYQLDNLLVFKELETMLDKVKPQAVVAFGSVYDHLAVVEACAPRGIHVMVEKPMAVSLKHAKRMVALAKKYKIHLLTDYETSWHPTQAKSMELIQEQKVLGNLKRIVVNTGHNGPKELGCDEFFLSWLTDPKLNGGGALVDFGCYGINYVTALTQGQKPLSVSAITRQLKPEVYPKVEDDATIVISYPNFECVIQASWNWTFDRKDYEVYGEQAFLEFNKKQLEIKKGRYLDKEILLAKDIKTSNYKDPFRYFVDVIQNKIKVAPFGVYSIENNLRVVEILELAKKSAKKGRALAF